MKVVINTCHGGFGLSHEAMLRYAEIKNIKLYPEDTGYGSYTYYTVPKDKRTPHCSSWHDLSIEERTRLNEQWRNERIYDGEIPRNDEVLVQIVKELGSKKASGRFANLKVVNIPDEVEWEIDDYDGMEIVAEVHRTWR